LLHVAIMFHHSATTEWQQHLYGMLSENTGTAFRSIDQPTMHASSQIRYRMNNKRSSLYLHTVNVEQYKGICRRVLGLEVNAAVLVKMDRKVSYGLVTSRGTSRHSKIHSSITSTWF